MLPNLGALVTVLVAHRINHAAFYYVFHYLNENNLILQEISRNIAQKIILQMKRI